MPEHIPGEPGFVPPRKPSDIQRLLSSEAFRGTIREIPLGQLGFTTDRVVAFPNKRLTRSDAPGMSVLGRFEPLGRLREGAVRRAMEKAGGRRLVDEGDFVALFGRGVPTKGGGESFGTAIHEFMHRAFEFIKETDPRLYSSIFSRKSLSKGGFPNEEDLVRLLESKAGFGRKDNRRYFRERLGKRFKSVDSLLKNSRISGIMSKAESIANAFIQPPEPSRSVFPK